MSAGISYVKKEKKNLLFFDFPTTNLYTSNAVWCAGGFLANALPLGNAFQHQKFIRDALKDMTCYTNMMVQEEKKRPAAFAPTFIKRVSCCALRAHFIDALR